MSTRQKIVILIVAIFVFVLAFCQTTLAGLHGTEWCSPERDYCQGYYEGKMYTWNEGEEEYEGGLFFYIDLDLVFIFFTHPIYLTVGIGEIAVGTYSLQSEIMAYESFGIVFFYPTSGGRIMFLESINFTPTHWE